MSSSSFVLRLPGVLSVWSVIFMLQSHQSIHQHRYNTVKTVKSRTVSTGQKGWNGAIRRRWWVMCPYLAKGNRVNIHEPEHGASERFQCGNAKETGRRRRRSREEFSFLCKGRTPWKRIQFDGQSYRWNFISLVNATKVVGEISTGGFLVPD